MNKRKIPTVRIGRPSRRPFQLRYTCPVEDREVRISTKTRDECEAERQKKELEAKLLLGIEAKPRTVVKGPSMPWGDFRHEYSRLKVSTFLSENSMYTAEMRLDVCESIISPRTLGKMASPDTLARLQAELLAGAMSKKEKRSPNTVESYVRTLQAALNWGHKLGWLPEVLHLDFDVDDESETFKGRPLTVPEFDAMLAACDEVCKRGPSSWKFLLRGLWESGLRLAEAMHLSWDDDALIMPLRTRGGGYLLKIPANMQKSRKSQEVPTTPAFAALLDEVLIDARTGWIFNPEPRRVMKTRLGAKQVGRILTVIGKRAEVFVNAEDKPASAHDLRRSFGQRMADAGLPPRDLQSIMRHSSLTTTEKYYLRHRAVEQAERIAMYLGTSQAVHKKTAHVESTQTVS
ncbi:MAG TPA: site-specific integrase [Pirellulaceae bacterium]|nr:site-specific integrase [Pirellulaceae bacterium]